MRQSCLVQPEQIAQHLASSLTERRGRTADRQALAVEPIGGCHDMAACRLSPMRLLQDQAATRRARRGQRVVQAQHLAAGDARPRQAARAACARRMRRSSGWSSARSASRLARAHEVGLEAFVVRRGPGRSMTRRRSAELRVGAHRDDQRPVGGVEHAIGDDRGMRVAVARRILAPSAALPGRSRR